MINIIPITTNMVDYSITAVDCLEFESLYICWFINIFRIMEFNIEIILLQRLPIHLIFCPKYEQYIENKC